jgi:hypothetical protein
LHKRCIVPNHPTLALIGFVTTYGSLHPIGEVGRERERQERSREVGCRRRESGEKGQGSRGGNT